MVGVIVVTHGHIGCEMITATKRIIPDSDHMIGIPIESDDPPEHIRQQIIDGIKLVDHGQGILILTDMFGGTPSNICLSFLNNKNIEVISGVNLPMLIKLASLDPNTEFRTTIDFIQQYGQRNIVIASHILKQAD